MPLLWDEMCAVKGLFWGDEDVGQRAADGMDTLTCSHARCRRCSALRQTVRAASLLSAPLAVNAVRDTAPAVDSGRPARNRSGITEAPMNDVPKPGLVELINDRLVRSRDPRNGSWWARSAVEIALLVGLLVVVAFAVGV
jgi:hypothetical protein